MHDSHVVKGMVLKRNAEGMVQRVADAKVAVYAQGVDTTSTETKVGAGAAGAVCSGGWAACVAGCVAAERGYESASTPACQML